MEIQFEDLDKSDFFIDCIYKGGKAPNMSSEPFHKLIPGCENAGGIRKKLREDMLRCIIIKDRWMKWFLIHEIQY